MHSPHSRRESYNLSPRRKYKITSINYLELFCRDVSFMPHFIIHLYWFEPMSSSVEAQSLNYCATRGVAQIYILKLGICYFPSCFISNSLFLFHFDAFVIICSFKCSLFSSWLSLNSTYSPIFAPNFFHKSTTA